MKNADVNEIYLEERF